MNMLLEKVEKRYGNEKDKQTSHDGAELFDGIV